MQTIAIACLVIVAVKSVFLMSTLWYMASTGHRPAWLPKMLAVNDQMNRANL